MRLALHPPQDGPVCLGATLSGTLDFRGSQEASARDSRTPKCVQVHFAHGLTDMADKGSELSALTSDTFNITCIVIGTHVLSCCLFNNLPAAF